MRRNNRKLAIILAFLMFFQVFTAGAATVGGEGSVDTLGDRAAQLDQMIADFDYGSDSFYDDVSVTRAVYESLPSEEWPFIQNYEDLLTAEADIAIAQTVVEAIGDLDIGSTTYIEDVTASRELHDSLTAKQQLLVTNYDILLAAEDDISSSNEDAGDLVDPIILEEAASAVSQAEVAATQLSGDGTDTLEYISVVQSVYDMAHGLVIELPDVAYKFDLEQRLDVVQQWIDAAELAVFESKFGFAIMSIEGDAYEPEPPIEHGYAQNNANQTNLRLSAGYLFGQIVLGQERTIDIAIKNESNKYMFNVGVELELEDGLEVVGPAGYVLEESDGKQTAYWKDIRNLQAGEEYVFQVAVKSSEDFRVAKEIEEEIVEVAPFGTDIEMTVNIYHSDQARVISGPPTDQPKVSVNDLKWTIVPFTIIPSHAPKVVKGAGEDEEDPSEWGKFEFTFDIVNNTLYETKFETISSSTDGAIRIYDMSDGGEYASDLVENERLLEWSDIVVGTGSPGSTSHKKTLSFTAAFFNKKMTAAGVNQGEVVPDGFRAKGVLSFNPVAMNGHIELDAYDDITFLPINYDLAVAKDITISKSVHVVNNDPEDKSVGYESALHYKLTVKTNEYYDVDDVVVIDTIGDGQIVQAAPVQAPADFVFNAIASDDWVLQWELEEPATSLGKRLTRQFTYNTEVHTDWLKSYGNGPIFAGDHIDNDVEVTGHTPFSGLVKDSDGTVVNIDTPVINEHISKLNDGDEIEESEVSVTVGDTVDFTINYLATHINALQNEIEIRNYLPDGMEPLAYVDSQYATNGNGDIILQRYEMNGVYPIYEPSSNMLIWHFSSVNVKEHFNTTIRALVLEEPVVKQDKSDQNLVTLSYENSAGIVGSHRDSVLVEYVEPELTLTRKVNRSNDPNHENWKNTIQINGEETAWVMLTLTNTGETEAYNVELNEALPDDFNIGTFTPLAGDYQTALNGRIVTFSLDESIAPGASATLIYSINMIANIGAGKDIYQSSTMSYYSQPNEEGRHYPHTLDANIELPHPTMNVPHARLKYELVQHGADDEVFATNGDKIRVGDWLVYKVSVDVPTNDVTYDPILKVSIPNKQELLSVMSNYDNVSSTGTVISETNNYTVTSASGEEDAYITFLAPSLPTDPGVVADFEDYVFYIKTRAEHVPSGQEAAQTTAANFSWLSHPDAQENERLSTEQRTVQVTIKTPSLSGAWFYNGTPYNNLSPVELYQGQDIELEYRITNGNALSHTAYSFEPYITVPDGYIITEASGHTAVSTLNDQSVEFHKVDSLAAGSTISYSVKVTMDSVPGSGANYQVKGFTGDFYSSQSTLHAAQYDSVESIAILGVPAVQITNIIKETTNDDNSWVPPGDNNDHTWIRPGDTITYKIDATVHAGTQAFELTVFDVIADAHKFELVPNSGRIAWNQVEAVNDVYPLVVWDDGYFNDGTLTVPLGDSPPTNDVDTGDPADKRVIYTIEFQLRAKVDGSKPTNPNAGSFDKLTTTSLKTLANATWFTTDDEDDPSRKKMNTVDTEQNGPVETSINVRQPWVYFEVNMSAIEFINDDYQEIEYTLYNDGDAPAFIREFKVSIPVGFIGSFDQSLEIHNELIWKWNGDHPSQLLVINPGESTTLSFYIKKTSFIGAAQNIADQITAELEHYYSTSAHYVDPSDSAYSSLEGVTTKRYTLDEPQRHVPIAIAPLTLTAEVIGNSNHHAKDPTNVRLGDVLVYELNLELPGSSPAYELRLLNEGLVNQHIVSVEYDGDVISPVDGAYLIGDVTSNSQVIVVTKVTDDNTVVPFSGEVSFEPEVSYYSIGGAVAQPQKAKGNQLVQSVIEPGVSVEVNATKTTLKYYNEESTITALIKSTGESTAYHTRVTVEITHHDKFDFVGSPLFHSTLGNPVSDEDINGIRTLTWSGVDLSFDAAGKELLKFTIKSKGYVGDVLEVIAFEIKYDSLPIDFATVDGGLVEHIEHLIASETLTEVLDSNGISSRATYDGIGDDESVTIGGSHQLSQLTGEDNPLTKFSGQTATYAHTLTNNGAGHDAFHIAVTGPTSTPTSLAAYFAALETDGERIAELVVGDDVVLIGTFSKINQDIVWHCADGLAMEDCDGGEYTVELEANESVEVILTVYVSEHVSYVDTEQLQFEIQAISKTEGNVAPATDTIHLTGEELDGWSGSWPYEQVDEWSLPSYEHGQKLELRAMTGNHVQEVSASIGDVDIPSDAFTLINDEDWIDDGYKLWAFNEQDDEEVYTLLHPLAKNETHEVIFKSYILRDGELVQDDTDANDADAEDPQLRWDNNAFQLVGPDLTIAIASDGTELTGDDAMRTVTVTVSNNGQSTAYGAEVKLNFESNETFIYERIGENDERITVLDGQSLIIPELGINQKIELKLEVSAPNTSKVNKKVDINATLVDYENEHEHAYEPNTNTEIVTITIIGNHELTADSPKTSTAGQPVTFTHTLTNTGAGEDTFTISITEGDDANSVAFPATLYELRGVDAEKIAIGQFAEGEWKGDTVNRPVFTLAAGGAVNLLLEVEVPAGAAKDLVSKHEIIATGQLSGVTKDVTDQVTVIAPTVTIELEATDSADLTFKKSSDTAEFILTIKNRGTHSAHDAEVEVILTDGLVLADEEALKAYSNIEITSERSFIWSIDELVTGELNDLMMTFAVTALRTVDVDADVFVEAKLAQYYDLAEVLGEHRESYTGNEKSIAIEIEGSHTLTTNQNKSTIAGKEVTFTHTLTNTGAGQDTYQFTVTEAAFSAQLYKVTADHSYILIGSGKWEGSSWVWDNSKTPEVTLNAGQSTDIAFVVDVPRRAGYNQTHTFKLEAQGTLSSEQDDVTDTLSITGTPLDGWSGIASYAEIKQSPTEWTQPTYGLVDSIFLSAVSAVNVDEVIAEITLDVIRDGAPDQVTLSAILYETNLDTMLNDEEGYKLWLGSTRLPVGVTVVKGTYDVDFTAYNVIYDNEEVEISRTALERDNVGVDAVVAANNPIAVETNVTIRGTITDGGSTTKEPIEGATVKLYNPITGEVIAKAPTDANGNYEFEDVEVAHYKLIVSKKGYSSSTQHLYALPKFGENEVIVDAQLLPYQIELFANPSSILGDGISETELTAIITDLEGEPLSGVKATFSSPTGRGTFPGDDFAYTDEYGVAKVKFRSEAVGGTASVSFPVLMKVEDHVNDLYAETYITITFEPGAIIGVVTEMIDGSDRDENDKPIKIKQPIEGARVVVTNEKLGFYAEQVTGKNGKYSIGVPVGNEQYNISITKPTRIGDSITDVTFNQIANVGVMDAGEYEEFPAVQTGSGIVLLLDPDEQTTLFKPAIYDSMKAYVDDELGNREYITIDRNNGTFNIEHLPSGSYDLYITIETQHEGQTKTLTLSQGMLEIDAHGEMNITTELVDPYGDVRDEKTKQLIEGAKVTLYYASGSNKDQEVYLPELLGFDPFDNFSPTQTTDHRGHYAWMVYPKTDYYIIATADGYRDYRSPNIRVDWDIVRHDIYMTPITPFFQFFPMPILEEDEEVISNANIDLAIDISADKRGYMEGSDMTLTIDYTNRSESEANNVIIVLDLPGNTEIVDIGDGELSESGEQVIWKRDVLSGGALDHIQLVLRANKIASQQQLLSAIAGITSSDELINLKDDVSKLGLMIFSNDYGPFEHVRYIQGYPDGEFKLNRNITRAEIATIFARILNLRPLVEHEQLYSDVPLHQWYADAVEAVTKHGLFTGYADGTFKPDQPITRAELTSVIFRFMQLEERPPVKPNFLDLIGHWAGDMIEDIYRNKIAQGYADGSFKPDQNIVRSEAVTMINRLMYRGPLHGAEQSYPDVPQDHWAFGDVEESTRSHDAIRNADASEQLIRHIDATLDF